jgi:uncharacterized SAM-binding protein YcdF (DUF218 family)
MTSYIGRAARIGCVAAAAASVCLVLFASRGAVLRATGAFLLRQDPPSAADVIVVVRGDEVHFDRALKAVELFDEGFASRIYVSSALDDLAAAELRAHGVVAASARDNLVGVLVQRGVPCDRIVVDGGPPGGGTEGEMHRVRAFARARDLTSAILVTSWFHTRRVKAIARRVLGDFKLFIVAADADSARDWWQRRYLALGVVDEYLKLIAYELGLAPRFADDPEAGDAAARLGPPSPCNNGRRDG